MPDNENNDLLQDETNEDGYTQPTFETEHSQEQENEIPPNGTAPGISYAASLATQNTFDKVVKQIRDASGTAMFIATLNILLGALFTLISAEIIDDIFEGTFVEPSVGFAYIIFGLIFLVLSIGIFYRSRICALLALVAFGADAIWLLANDGFNASDIGGLIMRGALLIALLVGMFACIRYHILRRRHRNTTDEGIAAAAQDSKAKMGGGRKFLYGLIGIIGIAALVYAAVTGVFDMGRNFDRWPEHQLVDITVRVPTGQIVVDSFPFDDIFPGRVMTRFVENPSAAVSLIAYIGTNEHIEGHDVTLTDLLEVDLHGLGILLLDSELEEDPRIRVENSSSGAMAGIRYYEVTARLNGHPVVYRTFVFEEVIYHISIAAVRESDVDLFPLFFDSLVIGE